MTDTASTQAQGIDVSKSQGTVNWPSVVQAGYVFTFIKATDGETYVDPQFESNWTGAKEAGLLRGAYHFFRAEDSPQAQVDFFWQTVGGSADLPLVVDVEQTMGVSNSTLIANLNQFLQDLQQLSGQPPMIYTYASSGTGWAPPPSAIILSGLRSTASPLPSCRRAGRVGPSGSAPRPGRSPVFRETWT